MKLSCGTLPQYLRVEIISDGLACMKLIFCVFYPIFTFSTSAIQNVQFIYW